MEGSVNDWPRYRKKPVEVEACQLAKGNIESVCCWCGGQILEFEGYRFGIGIRTLEGPHVARLGDWIVRGIEGEFYPVQDRIFGATYEPV